MRRILLIVAALMIVWPSNAFGQSNLESLSSWSGKYPITPLSKRRESIYETPTLRPRLVKLLGRKLYNRLARDYYVMAPIKLKADYLVAVMCVRHFCSQSSNVMAVNLKSEDIHVGFYYHGEAAWYHTKGKVRDLPAAIFQDVWWMQSSETVKPIASMREITRK